VFCRRTPKATPTDYYVDPKIMLCGTPHFEPHKTQNKVSESEFHGMREAMIRAGGGWRKAAKFFFVIALIYSHLWTLFSIGWLIYNFIVSDVEKGKSILNIPWWLSIIVLTVPHIVLQALWIIAMKKTSQRIADLFERENRDVYGAKGINWLTCRHLMYIRIHMVGSVDSEMQAFAKSTQPSQVGKSGKKDKNTNKEVLLPK
jgi:hypothetical protein